MRFLISGIGLLGALVLIGASASMNFAYWLTQGRSQWEADILASVSVAFDILKSVLPFGIAWAWTSRRRGYVTLASLLFALFFCFSLMSAIGFASSNRGAVAGGREADAMRLETSTSELRQAKVELGRLPPHKVAAVIAEELMGLRKDRLWNGSQSCNNPSGREARNFCKRYAERMTEQAIALSAEQLKQRIAILSRDVASLTSQGAGQGRDPQVAIVSLLSGLDTEGAKSAIIIFVAALVELGAAFGLFLAIGHSFDHFHAVGKTPIPETGNEKQDTLAPLFAKPAETSLTEPFKPLRLHVLDNGDLAVCEGGP